MPERPCDKYLKPYREAVELFGASFQATLWSTPEGQRLRFDVMIELGCFDGCVIVDAGCGRGDFAVHLLARGVPFERYIGIDAVTEMIDAARELKLPRCEFRIADLVTDPSPVREASPDFVCLSGTLNTMEQAVARKLVEACYNAAAQGVIFNFLSDCPHSRWKDKDLSPARRFHTIDWLQWSLELTSRVSFTQDYLDGHDATIMIRHD
jgi:SAM-dependent methyltransferase